MSSPERASRRNAFLFFLVVAIVLWVLPVDWNVFPAIITTLIAIGAGFYWLVTPNPGKDPAPDILAERFGSYFERDGLCFAAQVEAREGICFFDIYAQNHWSKPVEGTVHFIPMERTSSNDGGELTPVTTDLSLDGGEIGVIRIPYAVPARQQGRVMIYDVYADNVYPEGRGDVLRSRRGLSVDRLRSPLGEALHRVTLLSVHHAKLRNASIEIMLPTNVSDQLRKGSKRRLKASGRSMTVDRTNDGCRKIGAVAPNGR